jgi:hypothetical protein
MSVITGAVLLLIGVVVAIILLAPGGDEEPTEFGAPDVEPESAPDATPEADEDAPDDYDGVWEGTFTQYDSDGGIHGFWDLTLEIQNGSVVHAEETSDEFDYDVCEWQIVEEDWSEPELYVEYVVVPEHQDGRSCAYSGDLELVFSPDSAVGVSNITSEGVLEPTG